MKDVAFILEFATILCSLNSRWRESTNIIHTGRNISLFRKISRHDLAFSLWQSVFCTMWLGLLSSLRMAAHGEHHAWRYFLIGQILFWMVIFLFFAISCFFIQDSRGKIFNLSASAWIFPGILIFAFLRPEKNSPGLLFFSFHFFFGIFFWLRKNTSRCWGLPHPAKQRMWGQKKFDHAK